MLQFIKKWLGKFKIVLEIIRTLLRRERKAVLLVRVDERSLHSVTFLGELVPTLVTVLCMKQEYWYYNGREYAPSGLYKDWVMCYQEPNSQTVVGNSIVVYPRAHLHSDILTHYLAFLCTQSRGTD
jgi:hypothetical protein